MKNHSESKLARICELRTKEVINECTCKRLGCICDLEVDICTGCIVSIIVPGPAKFCGAFGRDMEFVIPFQCIKCIGDDIVIVNIDEDQMLRKMSPKDKMKDVFFNWS